MKSARVSAYETPRVETVSAAALLEMIGPVQGYAIAIGEPDESLTSVFGGVSDRPASFSSR